MEYTKNVFKSFCLRLSKVYRMAGPSVRSNENESRFSKSVRSVAQVKSSVKGKNVNF